MKKILTLALLCLACGWAVAQNLEVRHSDYSYLQLHYRGTALEVGETTLLGETFSTVSLPNAFSSLTPGAPALPMVTSLIEVPLCEGFEVTVTLYSGDTLTGLLPHPVVPAQPSRSKSDRSQPRLVMDRQLYQQDAFLGDFCQVERVGVARSKNLARVQFCPVQYNPVTGQLAEVKEAVVTIRFRQPDLQATRDLARHASSAFAPGTLNSLPGSKDIASAQTAPIHYMIVANPMFRGQLDEFVAWKQRKGFLVTVAYTDQPEVGSTNTSIAAYIKSFYTDATAALPAPTYLLLVGDCDQLPPFPGRWDYGSQSPNQQVTDLYYTTWTDGDLIPDCYCGRFSAENIGHLTAQVEKTLMYEQYTFSDPSFLDRAILVAGVDNGSVGDNGYKFGDPAMDYAAKYYVTPQRFPGGVTYYKNNTAFAPEGVTVTGSSQNTANAATLRQLYSEGAGWVNYTAHGDVTEWYSPSFTNSHVAQMTNREKFGFMIGNCCLTGKFNQTCLGETLLRKDNLCGAVEYFGGSNVTYWYEDFYWSVGVRNVSSINNTMDATYDAGNQGMYDRLFHTQGQPRSDWYLTAGAMMMAGNLAVESSTSSGKQYYWEVYHNFGDPSVMPYLGQAQVMNVQVSTAIAMGTATLTLTAAPYAYCALTDGQGTLIGAAFADANGFASIPTATLPAPGDYELACSAQGYQVSFTPITAFVPDGPFVKVLSLQTSLTAGDTALFALEVENVGTTATESLTAELILDGHHLFLLQNGQQSIANLGPGQAATLSGLFSAQVLPQVADQTATSATAIIRWGNRATMRSERTFSFLVDAPQLAVVATAFSGEIIPGDTIGLEVTYANQGHAASVGTIANLLCIDPAVGISHLVLDTTYGPLAPGGQRVDLFTLVLDSSLAPVGSIPLFLTLADRNHSLQTTLPLTLGLGSMEDFESASFASFPWQQSNYPWEITTTSPYDGSYCARSRTWSSSGGWWGGSNSGNNTDSYMEIVWESPIDDSISFLYSVSSESNYDYFRFYIDGQQKMQSSGEVGWTRASFPVPAGSHTFRFSYAKDASRASGSDCAWIDHITFPLVSTARHYALDTLCQGDSLSLPTYTFLASEPGTVLLTDTMPYHIYYHLVTTTAAPELSLEADPLTIPAGLSSLLTASGAERYLWATGETSPQLRVYPKETTQYTVVGTTGHCSATKSITITVDGTISIAPASQPSLTLYPNPTRGDLQVECEGMTAIEVFDLQGRRLMRQAATSSATLPVSSLPQGLYLLRATTADGIVVRRFVKQ